MGGKGEKGKREGGGSLTKSLNCPKKRKTFSLLASTTPNITVAQANFNAVEKGEKEEGRKKETMRREAQNTGGTSVTLYLYL